MAELSTQGREHAQSTSHFALAPVATDANNADLTASQRFAIGSAGDTFLATATGAFHLVAGDSTVVATTSAPAFAAGAHKLALPDGCTHVAMLRAAAVATLGCAYRG